MEDSIFEVSDKKGRKIRLTKKQWKHMMRRHPYMERHVNEIKETISNADKIVEKPYGKGYYYKGYKYLKKPNKFVFVVVKYLNEHGYVITSYLESGI